MIKTESGYRLRDIDIVLQFRVSENVDWSVLIEDRITGNYYVANNATSTTVYNAMKSDNSYIIASYLERHDAFDLIDQQIPGILIA